MKRASLSADSTVVVVEDQVSTALPGEVVILHLKQGIYYGLGNDVGARIWEHLREPRKISQIRDALVGEYEVDPGQCEKDLLSFLEELAGEGLIRVKKNGKTP